MAPPWACSANSALCSKGSGTAMGGSGRGCWESRLAGFVTDANLNPDPPLHCIAKCRPMYLPNTSFALTNYAFTCITAPSSLHPALHVLQDDPALRHNPVLYHSDVLLPCNPVLLLAFTNKSLLDRTHCTDCDCGCGRSIVGGAGCRPQAPPAQPQVPTPQAGAFKVRWHDVHSTSLPGVVVSSWRPLVPHTFGRMLQQAQLLCTRFAVAYCPASD